MNTSCNKDNHSVMKTLLAFALLANSAHAQQQPKLDAALKPAFAESAGFVTDAVVQNDGQIIVAGAFNAVNGMARNGLARLRTDGTVDPSFDAGSICCGTGSDPALADPPVLSLLLQGDGKLILGGSFTNVQGVVRMGLARLNPDGKLDTSFDAGAGLIMPGQGLVRPRSLVLQADGKLLVGGVFTSINGTARNGIARLNSDGTVDPSFDPGIGLNIGDPADAAQLSTIAVLPNKQILIGGAFLSYNGGPRTALARLNADGSLDLSFDIAINQQDTQPSVDHILVQGDGGLLLSGSFNYVDPEGRIGVARLKPDGKNDTAFNPAVDWTISETYAFLARQSDGKILVDRQYTDANGSVRRALIRLNPDGTVNPALNLELLPGEGSRLSLAGVRFQPNGKLLVAGNFKAGPNGSHESLISIDLNGNIDAFAPRFQLAEGASANVLSVAAQKDGKVLVGGAFRYVGGTEAAQLVRLNSDGTIDTAFKAALPANGPQEQVSALLLRSDGKLFIGGNFTQVNGTSRNGIALLSPDGTVDNSFDVGTGTAGTGSVTAFAEQSDGKLLVAGDFSSLNGVEVPWVGRLNTNGNVDLGFSVVFRSCADCGSPLIRQIGVLSNGFVMLGGSFERVEAFTANGLARLRPDGSADIGYNTPLTASEEVTAMVIDAQSRTTVAIRSADPSGAGDRTRLIRLTPDGTLDPTFKADDVLGDGSLTPPVQAIALDSQGRLVVAGQFGSVGSVPRHGLARLHADGSLDNVFDAGATFSGNVLQGRSSSFPLVNALALQDNGGILVGGRFAAFGGDVRLGLARFLSEPTNPGTGGGNAYFQTASRATDGTFTASIVSDAGHTYNLDVSSDLRTWTLLKAVAGSASAQAFTDAEAKTQPRRFYRLTAQ